MQDNQTSQSPSFEKIVQPDKILSIYSDEADRRKSWNIIQLLASLRLINYFFGAEWYSLVFQRIEQSVIPDNPRYRRYLQSSKPTVHPLTKWYWTGGPEELVRMVRLGEALKVLGSMTAEANLLAKTEELRSASFIKAYFELKTALIYARSGFDVRFLVTKRGIRSPDLMIGKNGFKTHGECKKRDFPISNSLQARVGGVLDRLRDANSQLAAAGNHGIAFIEVEDGLDHQHPDITAYTEAIMQELRILSVVSCVMLTWEKIVDQGEAVYVVTEARGIPNPKSSGFRGSLFCNPNNLAPSSPPEIITNGAEAPPLPEQ